MMTLMTKTTAMMMIMRTKTMTRTMVMTMIRHLISKVALDKPKWLLLIEISGMSPLEKEQL